MKPTQKLHELGQSLWLDNITRTMLDDGTLERYVDELSITGLTSNPTIFDHAISEGHAYDDQIAELKEAGASAEDAFFELAIADLRRAARMFEPVHERTDRLDGWVSLEVSPLLADDAEGTVRQAAELHARADAKNLLIKIPGTEAGLVAIEETIFAGIPVNVTLLFSREHYLAASRGLHARDRAPDRRRPEPGRPLRRLGVHQPLGQGGDGPDPARAPRQAGHRHRPAHLQGLPRDARLRALAAPVERGARPQRLLWASTGTKDPDASDVLYIEALAAPFTINTMPEPTLLAFAEHGDGRATRCPADGGDCEAGARPVRRARHRRRGPGRHSSRTTAPSRSSTPGPS